MRLGKFFFIRHKSIPRFLLEVEDGATDEEMFVSVSEPEPLGHDSVDHQLWYFDRVTQTVRTKLNDFCLQMNGNASHSYTTVLPNSFIFTNFCIFCVFRVRFP